MHRQWKTIQGWTSYQVSDDGLVKNASGHLLAQRLRKGYFRVNLHSLHDHKLVTVSRLVAQAFVPGFHSSLKVTFINKDTTDARACNLRIASSAQTGMTRRLNNGKEVPKGVDRRGSKWRARCTIHQREYYLGTYITYQEAAAAYDAFARRHAGAFSLTNERIGLL